MSLNASNEKTSLLAQKAPTRVRSLIPLGLLNPPTPFLIQPPSELRSCEKIEKEREDIQELLAKATVPEIMSFVKPPRPVRLPIRSRAERDSADLHFNLEERKAEFKARIQGINAELEKENSEDDEVVREKRAREQLLKELVAAWKAEEETSLEHHSNTPIPSTEELNQVPKPEKLRFQAQEPSRHLHAIDIDTSPRIVPSLHRENGRRFQ